MSSNSTLDQLIKDHNLKKEIESARNAGRPNILVILDDQHRHDYIGYVNPELVDTPNINKLAARGSVFTHCCTNSTVCAPARTALATGLLPMRTGCLDNNDFLPLSANNHYRWFRDHGYRVEMIGRHDLAKDDGAPKSIYGNRSVNFSYGFTRALEIEGGMAAAMDCYVTKHPVGPFSMYLDNHGLLETYVEDYMKRKSKGWIIGASHDSPLPAEHHQDEYTGDRAVERIRDIEGDYPWYMFVSFQSPHDPFDPPAFLGKKYRDVQVPDPIPVQHEDKSNRTKNRYKAFSHATSEDIVIARRQYLAKVELIDRQVGKIMDALEQRGELDNTIVVFASDHGEHLGDHGLFCKETAYEPSLRVPLVIAGPGIIRQSSDALVELFDINPTLVELARLPEQYGLDARSVAGILRGESSSHREGCVTCLPEFRAIRTKTHTYIQAFNDLEELYDLENDPDQLKNIINSVPDTAESLRRMMYLRFTEGKWEH